MSYCSASCTSVRSPLIAAIATFALKADVWFRRGLLLMLSPDSRAKSCPLSGRSSTYRPVQILEAGSDSAPKLLARVSQRSKRAVKVCNLSPHRPKSLFSAVIQRGVHKRKKRQHNRVSESPE